MSISEIVIKVLGVLLAVVGVLLLLSLAGVSLLGVGAINPWVAGILGLAFVGLGIWLIRGGTIRA
jgi:hypothetical protein